MSAILFDLFETLITEWGRPKYTTRKIAEALDVDYGEFRREWESLHMDRYLGRISGTDQVLKTILDRLQVDRSADQILEVARVRDASKKGCFESIKLILVGAELGTEAIPTQTALKFMNVHRPGVEIVYSLDTNSVPAAEDAKALEKCRAIADAFNRRCLGA